MQLDVFEALRKFHHQGERFDVIVLDPPKFVDSKANLMNACRGYKDINRLAVMLLKPGGTLLTFSCSGLLSGELFQKVVADACLDAKRPMHIIEHLFQSADHPVRTNFPESLYLKGYVLRG
jgi:23S rRNA (cytosine1962-C5)-methyltransferase